jgi:hypothetical protein
MAGNRAVAELDVDLVGRQSRIDGRIGALLAQLIEEEKNGTDETFNA